MVHDIRVTTFVYYTTINLKVLIKITYYFFAFVTIKIVFQSNFYMGYIFFFIDL